MQTLTRRGVGDAAAGLGLHFLHMSKGPFSNDAGHISKGLTKLILQLLFELTCTTLSDICVSFLHKYYKYFISKVP